MKGLIMNMHDVFRAGVEPGGLTADYEIKMLLCHILRKIERPMPVYALIEVFVSQGISNYFEVASAAASLVKTGHLRLEETDGERCYILGILGDKTAETLEQDLPPAIRDKAVAAAEDFFRMKKRRAQNKTEIKKAEDGYLLTLTITDVGSDLLRTTILVPDRKTADEIADRFVKDPVRVYKGVVAVLTGNFECVGPLL